MTTDIVSQACNDLTRRLAAFGFEVPLDEIFTWSVETLEIVRQTTTQWETDYRRAMQGISTPAAYRNSVPRELAAFEAIPASTARQARDHGRSAAMSDVSVDCNPYPPETALSRIWHGAYEARQEGAAT